MKRGVVWFFVAVMLCVAVPARAADIAPYDLAQPLPVVAFPKTNQTFGTMYFPRLKSKFWGQKLIAGIATRQLNAGIGWFPTTSLPGQLGNFAVAGHRATYGEPLAYVDRIRKGDRLFIKTDAAWYVYRMTHDQITTPKAVWVIDPVPGDVWNTKPTQRLITIVTCEPRWGSSKRWIWWGELTAAYPPENTLADVMTAESK